jgi:peptidoglycan/xylan/chitin deacetylase (PgdA/CDA1 family)
MNKRIANFLLYLLAAGFLIWHLTPMLDIGNSLLPRQKTTAELANDTTCYGNDLDVPTYGDPLHDPLITTLSDRPKLINASPRLNSIEIDPLPASTTFANDKSWQTSSYGQNEAKFSLPKETSGNPVLRVDIANFKDGDAKWQTPILNVQEGQSLRLTNRYRSNVETTANVTFIYEDGSNDFVTLTPLAPSDYWQTNSVDVVIPDGVSTVRFSIILNNNGWLETTKYQISSYETPMFKRGIVSFTFDDGWKSIYEQGLPLFEKYNVKTTQFIVSGYEGSQAYMTEEQIRDMIKRGHDIGSHSHTHADHRELDQSKLSQEVAGSRSVLNATFSGINNFATPFGRYNDTVKNTIKQCYQSHRTTDTGYNAPGYDRYSIRVQNVEVDTTAEEIREWAKFARDNNLWLVLVYHQVEDGGTYSVDTKALEEHLRAVKDTGVHTANFEEALIETYSQGR